METASYKDAFKMHLKTNIALNSIEKRNERGMEEYSIMKISGTSGLASEVMCPYSVFILLFNFLFIFLLIFHVRKNKYSGVEQCVL